MRVIVCSDGNLDTFEEIMEPTTNEGYAVSDTTKDVI
jgi:hypothetical protein